MLPIMHRRPLTSFICRAAKNYTEKPVLTLQKVTQNTLQRGSELG